MALSLSHSIRLLRISERIRVENPTTTIVSVFQLAASLDGWYTVGNVWTFSTQIQLDRFSNSVCTNIGHVARVGRLKEIFLFCLEVKL